MSDKRILLAGPCSAESEQQVLTTAQEIISCVNHDVPVSIIFRAGIWKPRTSPHTFQGVGDAGLCWLQRVQRDYGLPVAIEVANAQQVSAALDAGMNYLWVGARTSANPIAVQEIAHAVTARLQSSSMPFLKALMVKNPVNEDVALWLGNIARLESAGLPVMAIHRGCSHRPCWNMPYELRLQRPDIPLLMDPSHLSGDASAISPLCMKAMHLDYQGWMVESHIAPTEALSDAKQQITPSELGQIMQRLFAAPLQTPTNLDLEWLRCMIDEVDDDIWNAIERRMEISHRIGELKKTAKLPVVQPLRYQEIVRKRLSWSENTPISQQAIEQIMEILHKESVRMQS